MGEDVERQPLLNQEHGNITNIFLEHDLMKGGGGRNPLIGLYQITYQLYKSNCHSA